ncbi:MAG TPA: FAD-binding oxidoreductase [Microlunatus sp.]|jgi:ferredoxin-NADP reductase|nr:FAD-binding oxidoreductase [Microlunatus sp.]
MPVASRVSTWLVGTVSTVQPVNEHARVIMIEVPDWPGSLPGQHLDLRLTAEDGYQAVRSYSIASFGPASRVELAVDEFPEGEVSPYLVREVRPGDLVEVRGPIGRYFVWSSDQSDPVQLIAGGSGIVPLMAIVRAHRAAGSAAPFRLIYSVRSRADALYADELESLVDEHFGLEWVYTRRAPDGAPRRPRRIDAEILASVVIAPTERPLVYVCGPTGFVETVAGTLVALGHEADRVRTERFGGA